MKWFFRIILLGIAAVLLLGVYAYFSLKSTVPPEIEKAPYAIQTYSSDGMMIPSRIYYAEEVVIEGSVATINEYWSYDGEKYHKQKGEKEIPEPYKLVRRLQ